MNDKQRNNITKAGIETYNSMVKAFDQAGGNVPVDILDMTVLELISLISTNSIRFKYVGKTREYEENLDPKNTFLYSNDNAIPEKCPKCGVYTIPSILRDNEKWKYGCRKCFCLFGKK